MDEINIFFLTSFHEDELNQTSIFINNKNLTQYILPIKGNFIIIVNEIRLSDTKKRRN